MTSDWSESRLPAPTDPRIQGFFNITEEAWGYYIREEDSWRILGEEVLMTTREESLRAHGVVVAPDIFDVDSSQLNWMMSNSFIDRHRGERIGGAFLVCKENRLIWFHLSTS